MNNATPSLNRNQTVMISRRQALSLGVEVRDVDFLEVVNTAKEERLTAYDASYLWLARESDAAELVTLDGPLENAWKGTP